MGKFEKGNSAGKGRGKGVPNKTTAANRAMIQAIIDSQGDRPQKEIEKLEGKAYVDAIFVLYEYVTPKLARTEIAGDGNAPISINITKTYAADSKTD